MPVAFPIQGSWRIDTPNKRLAVALAASLIIHAVGYGTWIVTPVVAQIIRAAAAQVLNNIRPRTATSPQEAKQNKPAEKREVQMVFVEVDPALAAAEPPKETPFYSTQNTLAANEQPRTDSNVPNIDGSQSRMVRLMDNPRPQPKPMQPAPAPEPKALQPTPPAEPLAEIKLPAEKPKPPETIGDLALAKPQPKIEAPPFSAAETPQRQRPRTLREAMQRNPSLVGQKMQQEGGVQRRAHMSMLDTKHSVFGDYDYQFIKAVEARWYQLLDNNQYMLDRQGKVVLEFKLHYDGRITAMGVQENTVGDILSLLCQKAILDPAPFPRWPADMRRDIKEDFREVRFTFYYD